MDSAVYWFFMFASVTILFIVSKLLEVGDWKWATKTIKDYETMTYRLLDMIQEANARAQEWEWKYESLLRFDPKETVNVKETQHD